MRAVSWLRMWLKNNGLNQFIPPGYTLQIRETLQY